MAVAALVDTTVLVYRFDARRLTHRARSTVGRSSAVAAVGG
jgi:hypothetical protein